MIQSITQNLPLQSPYSQVFDVHSYQVWLHGHKAIAEQN